MSKPAYSVFIVLLVMWLVRIVDAIVPADLAAWGLRPRSLTGLVGIPLSPFLHGSFGHLISNSVPLAILLLLTVTSRHRPWPIIASIVLGGGSMLWILGRNSIHVGASGLVFGLITYLITVGVREKQIQSMGIAILVGFLYGGTLIFGVLPSFGSVVSWEGHLFGAIAGAAVGYFTTARS
jgi:membrane associated rhomboid family serine protease